MTEKICVFFQKNNESYSFMCTKIPYARNIAICTIAGRFRFGACFIIQTFLNQDGSRRDKETNRVE
jgi:hypothetical protein